MSLLLFLNELSCRSDASPREVDQAMETFVKTLRHLRTWPRGIALITQSPLPQAELAVGYVYGEWRNSSARNRDNHRFLLSLRSRSPFQVALPEADDATEIEYRHDGQIAQGLGAAHLANGMSISLPISPKWAHSWLGVDVHRLTESGIECTHEQVRHCSTRTDADEHTSWARSVGLSSLTNPQQLLSGWDEFFPHLQKLPRFERDLRALDVKWHRPVRNLLIALEESAADWKPEISPEPAWRTPHITSESASRQNNRLCFFVDLDGIKRSFPHHGRFTPGKGRLHFRLLPEETAFRLAYVGDKLGSDSD